MVLPNIYQIVAPTTIEEYTLLLSLGRRLGLKDMPPLNLEDAR